MTRKIDGKRAVRPKIKFGEPEMKGDHFTLFKQEGQWHWALWGRNHPTGPIAKSRQEGYASPSKAEYSMQSARRAMHGAIDDSEKLRIERLLR